ncbi:MAG: DUF1987 domain-containing protein [Bacteroidales bacterium]|nr:DUF1987 domain-containing protein [Bacteroidales bacterium]
MVYEKAMMEELYVPGTALAPEIKCDPATWEISIKGTSAPEDVRTLYYPVIEWTSRMVATILANPGLTGQNGVTFILDLNYFNSSSAKFLHDIFSELVKLKKAGSSLEVRWFYDREDVDMYEAGQDMALLTEMDFIYLEK